MNMPENTIDHPFIEILEVNPNQFNVDILFQHDRAPPNYIRQIRSYLDNNFLRRCIGRRRPS